MPPRRSWQGLRWWRGSTRRIDPTIRQGWPQQLVPGGDAEYLTVTDLDGRRLHSRIPRRPRARGYRNVSSQLSFANLDGDGKVEAYTYQSRTPRESSEDEVGFFLAYQDRRAAVFRKALVHQVFHRTLLGGIAIGDVDGDGVQELVAGVYENGCGVAPCAWASKKNVVRRGVVVQRLDGSLVPKFPKPLPRDLSRPTSSVRTAAGSTGTVPVQGEKLMGPRKAS